MTNTPPTADELQIQQMAAQQFAIGVCQALGIDPGRTARLAIIIEPGQPTLIETATVTDISDASGEIIAKLQRFVLVDVGVATQQPNLIVPGR